MFYFAYIDSSNKVVNTYAMPSDLSAVPGYITITEQQHNDSQAGNENSLIGKYYDAETNTFYSYYYYAILDVRGICTEVIPTPQPLNETGFVEITEQQYSDSIANNENSIIGLYWDGSAFVTPPASLTAAHTAGEIYCEAEEKLLSEVLADKADASDLHEHSNKTVLDGITAEKVAAWDNGTGSGSGTPGADGEDGITPHIGTNGNWYLGETDTGVAATGPAGADGEDGVTPHIGENGNWFIGTTDTGVSAQGASGATITATEILEKLHGVDGQNSGLDADLLDGHDSTYFATATQLNGKAPLEHTHEGYAATGHTHEGYAAEGHTHTGYATTSDLAGKADANHSHNDYINATTYANGMNSKADVDHTHTGYAASNHSHSGYASANHSHSDYLPTSGGTVNGNLNVSGILRVNGQQAVYDSGTMVTLSTNNRKTMIAGSEIYSKVAISVSSDRRLKENIKEVSADDMTKFINGLDIKSFNYIGNDEPCIGVIAQEVTESDPELAKCFVRQDEKGYYSVKAADLVFPLIAAVQKLAREVEELKNR